MIYCVWGGGGHVLNCMHVHICVCVCVLFMSELIVLLRLIIFIYLFIYLFILRLFSKTSRGSPYSCQTVVEARSQLHPNKEKARRHR